MVRKTGMNQKYYTSSQREVAKDITYLSDNS
jgi:hypothetical protein